MSADFRDCFDRLSSEGRPAEIGMNDDAGRVDDSANRRPYACGGAGFKPALNELGQRLKV